MRILVTGWAGYIGPKVVERLSKEPTYHVTGLDSGMYIADWAAKPWYPKDAVFEDIRTAQPLPDVRVVVHLAGLSNDPIGEFAPDLTRITNYRATLRMIDQYPDAHHIHVSSCSVYGAAQMAYETTTTNPLTEYARSKRDVDLYLESIAHRMPRRTILRLGTVYGYSPGHRLDLVVNRMTHDAVTKGVVTASGDAARPLVHIEDVADAIAWAIRKTPMGIHNIVGENWRMADLGAMVARVVGAKLERVPAGADARDYAASGEKALAAGFHPTRTVEASLPELAERSRSLPAGRLYERLPIAKRTLVTMPGRRAA